MGNNSNKYKMQSDIDDITIGMNNIQINNVPGWIKNSSTQQLEIIRSDILYSMSMNDQQSINAWTRGDITQMVTDQNRNNFEYNFFNYLQNIQNNNVGIPTKNDIMNMTKNELVQICKDYNINYYSGKNKSELQTHILNYFHLV